MTDNIPPPHDFDPQYPPIEKNDSIVWPNNIEAEQGLLGALMIDNKALDHVVDFLKPEHFYYPVHARLYEAIGGIINQGKTASPVTLRQFFESDESLSKVGGADYLADLAAGVVSLVNTKDYGETILDLSKRREMLRIADELKSQSLRSVFDISADKVIEQIEGDLFNMAERGIMKGPESLVDGLHRTIAMIEKGQKGELTGIQTGISSFDKMNNGFYGGQLITIAARPSMGKTALALTLSHNVAQSMGNVLFFSMEMSSEEICQRLFARYTGFATGRQMREGGLQNGDWHELIDAQQKLAKLPLAIDESGRLSVGAIRARARRHMRRKGLDMIVIDYLNIMNMGDRYQSKVDQIGETTAALKGLAKDLGVPVILLAQLNRDVEKREDKRPHMADLRDSGAIEQDSDIVLFIYREEYYLERDGAPRRREKETDDGFNDRVVKHEGLLAAARGQADIIIGKWRQGKVGDVRVRFDPVRQVFFDKDMEGGAA